MSNSERPESSSTASRGSEVLAFTCCYRDRGYLEALVPAMRGTAGTWFDWAVFLGAPSSRLLQEADSMLRHPGGRGVQYLKMWGENRGQHWATKEALALARERGYNWLLRLDDDIKPKSKDWLKKMLSRARVLKDLAKDKHYRLVLAPRIIGLKNPIQPEGVIQKGQNFPAEVMPVLGGACRLHPTHLFRHYEPNLYAPIGRGDPQSIARYLQEKTVGGMLVRFPDIRVTHRTSEIEAKDSEDQAHQRIMSWYWPWLGETA